MEKFAHRQWFAADKNVCYKRKMFLPIGDAAVNSEDPWFSCVSPAFWHPHNANFSPGAVPPDLFRYQKYNTFVRLTCTVISIANNARVVAGDHR